MTDNIETCHVCGCVVSDLEKILIFPNFNNVNNINFKICGNYCYNCASSLIVNMSRDEIINFKNNYNFRYNYIKEMNLLVDRRINE